MSEEIKPVAILILPGICGDEFSGDPDIDWSDSREADRLHERHVTGTDDVKLPMYIIPATHRIVPVELLERCSREFQSMEGTELAYPEHASAVQCYHELRAIIDKEST